ncbi:polymorphic toxin type 44 domain-containing protein, partial [Phyllobacterium leguminum]
GGFLERLGAQQISQSAVANAGNASLARNFIMGRAGHPDDEVAQFGGLKKTIKTGNTLKWLFARGLDIALLGGGEWDLKPRISAIWGAKNRLGNREYYIFCDYFSNLHYGYVAGASGYSIQEANDLADIEGDDAPEDKKATSKGLQLNERKRKVTWQDITRIVEMMPEIHTYG